MPAICFYFHVHQPFRIKHYRVFDIGQDSKYFVSSKDDRLNNKKIFNKVAQKCYIPAGELMLELLEKHPEFKISYSISGVFLEQAEAYNPKVIEIFQKLVKTNRVELLDETYYHSLAFLYSKDEYISQIKLHTKKIKEVFGVTPQTFRNTELIYNNKIAQIAEDLGYKAILAEGAEKILGWKSPNFVYKPKGTKKIKLLLKNYKLSDDIAFRFSEKNWKEHPLTVNKYVDWINSHHGNGEIINLFMDYETLGEHQWEDSGIFEFLRELPAKVLEHKDNSFVTPLEASKIFEVKDEIDVTEYVSWADVERDLSAWLSNSMQEDALAKLYEIEQGVKKSKNKTLLSDWRKLQTSDHFYYMCTKWFADGDVHKYFNPYESPYEAFIAFMNVMQDMNLRLTESS